MGEELLIAESDAIEPLTETFRVFIDKLGETFAADGKAPDFSPVDQVRRSLDDVFLARLAAKLHPVGGDG